MLVTGTAHCVGGPPGIRCTFGNVHPAVVVRWARGHEAQSFRGRPPAPRSTGSPSIGPAHCGLNVRAMPIRPDNVGIAVRDLEAAIGFFTDLGLTVLGRARISGEWADTAAALQIAARHGCNPLRGVATYEDVYKLTYLRGPSDILVMFAEELQKD